MITLIKEFFIRKLLKFKPFRNRISPRDRMVEKAYEVWNNENIRDNLGGVPNPDITRIFDLNGWGIWLRQRCPDGYTRPPDPDWCGHAMAYFGHKLDNPVDPELAKIVFPSTYRLNSLQKWNEAGYDEIPSVPPKEVKKGDIVVFRWEDGKSYGDHIALCVKNPVEGQIVTIEGNAHGEFSDGSWGRGIVKRTRETDLIVRVYRLDSRHFEE